MGIVRSVGVCLVTAVVLTSGYAALTAAPQSQQSSRIWGSFYTQQTTTSRGALETLKAKTNGKPRPSSMMTRLSGWNEMAIDMAGVDHTPPVDGELREYAQQYGPGRTSRAMAMVHLAMFEVVNAFYPRYESYIGAPPAPPGASIEAALAQAAHDTLHGLYSAQGVLCDQQLAADLQDIPDTYGKREGTAFGARIAAAVLQQRADDGSGHLEPRVGIEFTTSDDPGKWRQDPISGIPLALGAHWGGVTPFVIESPALFRAPLPPDMATREYTAAYHEVQRLGGDGIVTPTERTPEQSFAGIFWAYDGTPSLCAPGRLYNQIVMTIAAQMGTDFVDTARLLALVNVAMADAGIAVWESKFHYQVWRPITGIRESDEGTGPTGLGDGNLLTRGDSQFTPFGAPASNLHGPNFTPPFPAYPSGHAGLGGAVFQTLRNFYGTDDIPFTFVSDEWNGVTRDNMGVVRPLIPRTFASLSEAEEENGQSRIYLGIHWAFDKTAGIDQGRRIANHVYQNAFRPREPGRRRGPAR